MLLFKCKSSVGKRNINILYNSKTKLVCVNYINHAVLYVNFCSGAKLSISHITGVDIIKYKLSNAIKHILAQIRITVEQQADIENLRNLMFVRSKQSFIEGFDHTEIDCMTHYMYTTGH